MSKRPTEMGLTNRTGIGMSPISFGFNSSTRSRPRAVVSPRSRSANTCCAVGVTVPIGWR